MVQSFTVFIFLVLTSTAFSKEMKFKTLDDLDKCEAKHSYDTGVCFEPTSKYVKAHPKQAFEVAKKARRVFASWVSLEWFDIALTKNKNKKVCDEHEFHLSFLNAFGQSPDGKPFKLAQKLLAGECQKSLVPIVLKDLDTSAGSTYTEAVCPTIKKAGLTHVNCEPKKETVATPVVEETLPKVEKNKIELSSTVKVFKGPEGSRFSMVKVNGDQNLFLIKFEGVDSPWSGKSLLHKETNSGTDGTADYWTEVDGKRWNTIVKRNCYQGYCNYEGYLPGHKGALVFSYDETNSKTAKSSDVLSSF